MTSTAGPELDVAKAALCDIGRPDLAALVQQGAHGVPVYDPGLNTAGADRGLIMKAFLIAHTHDEHRPVLRNVEVSGVGWIHCDACEAADPFAPGVPS